MALPSLLNCKSSQLDAKNKSDQGVLDNTGSARSIADLWGARASLAIQEATQESSEQDSASLQAKISYRQDVPDQRSQLLAVSLTPQYKWT